MFDGNQASRAVGVPLYYGFIEAVFIGVYLVGMWKAGWLPAPSTRLFIRCYCGTGRSCFEEVEADGESRRRRESAVVVDETPPSSSR